MKNFMNISGRIPNSEKAGIHFYPANGDKKAFMYGMLSVAHPYKKDSNNYPASNLFPFKAHANNAELINKFFKNGDSIELLGFIDKDDAYTTSSGEERDGQFFLNVTGFEFPLPNNKKSDSSTDSPAQKQSLETRTATSKPLIELPF